ncbi:MAG: hypothetical protein JST31_06945 [Actinobacteria bacterium]|nr:hypothetical protein [Actinomycetota bacterium]
MTAIRGRGLLALATAACAGAAIVPVSAATAGAAGPSAAKGATASRTDTKAEATQECKAKLRKNKKAFVERYGGTGTKAMNRCVKAEMHDTNGD